MANAGSANGTTVLILDPRQVAMVNRPELERKAVLYSPGIGSYTDTSVIHSRRIVLFSFFPLARFCSD